MIVAVDPDRARIDEVSISVASIAAAAALIHTTRWSGDSALVVHSGCNQPCPYLIDINRACNILDLMLAEVLVIQRETVPNPVETAFETGRPRFC